MAFSTSVPLQPYHTFSSTPCKLPSPFLSFTFSSDSFSFPLTKHTLEPRFSPFFEVRAHPAHLDTEKEISKKSRNGKIIDRLDSRVPSVGPEDFKRAVRQLVLNDKEISKKTRNRKTTDKVDSGFSSVGPKDIKRVGRQLTEKDSSSMVEASIDKRVIKLKDKRSQNSLGPGGRGDFSSLSKDEKSVKNVPRNGGIIRASKKADEIPKKDESCQLGPGKWQGYKHLKFGSPQITFKVGLEMCTKKGDVMGAIRLYELAKREGISIGQYHYAVLLYLCSSAATGIVQPAKSGSGSRSSTVVDLSNEGSPDLDEAGKMVKRDFGNIPENCEEREGNNLDQLFSGSTEIGAQTAREFVQLMIGETRRVYVPNYEIKVGEDVKNYALRRGLEIYEEMILEKVEMNEAILTSLARMAMSMGNGDMAFDLVKQMKELGINPRLRSYGPALSVFCNDGDIEKAFLVEEHMLAHGVYPEESELEALMRVSVEASKGDKVYYLLHKLRTSVRKVLPSTADLIAMWFSSSAASRVGKRKWDQRLIVKAVEKGGGGWHGQGWLGKGKWNVLRTCIGADGLCKSCGEKLVTIDLDPTETAIFAESVARIAKQKEKDSSFQKFQKWLDCYGPLEAVVDAANAGLFAQRKFTPSKVDEIANGIQQKLSSIKFPLIVLHHKRLTGGKMEKGLNKRLIEKWKNANALYATPTGSNDDWYWLYAAIRFKCLLVTNDEMRDHLFQLLGNDFFPKWKERHQVRFTFPNTGPEFHMPPPYSVVIQESEKGHWHIPIESEEDSEGLRMWLCITRSRSDKGRQASVAIGEGSRFTHNKEDHASPDPATDILQKLPALKHSYHQRQKDSPRNSRNTVSSSPITNQIIMQPKIEAAEKLGDSIIDFQI